MAVSRIERFLLKTMVYSSLAFDPEKLDPDASFEEDAKTVKYRFNLLDNKQKAAFRSYFKRRPLLPFRIYRRTGTKGNNLRNFKFHYEYDLPDRMTEARRLVLAGFDLKQLKGDYYTYAQLHELRKAHESGLDITPLLSNEYSRFQLKVLVPALREGFDLSELADPGIPAREMMAIYYEHYEERLIANQTALAATKQIDLLEKIEEAERKVEEKTMRRPSLDRQISAADSKREKNNVIAFQSRQHEHASASQER